MPARSHDRCDRPGVRQASGRGPGLGRHGFRRRHIGARATVGVADRERRLAQRLSVARGDRAGRVLTRRDVPGPTTAAVSCGARRGGPGHRFVRRAGLEPDIPQPLWLRVVHGHPAAQRVRLHRAVRNRQWTHGLDRCAGLQHRRAEQHLRSHRADEPRRAPRPRAPVPAHTRLR